MPKILRGFTIRYHRAGEPLYSDQKVDTWAEKGALPSEWEQVKNDPQVDRAVVYSSAQRKVRADKRRFIDRHVRDI